MNKEEIKLKIIELKNELPMLCDSDYYNACDELEYLVEKLSKLEEEELEDSFILFDDESSDSNE